MKRKLQVLVTFCGLFAGIYTAKAQTDMDAIMMGKKQLCIGPMYTYSSWKNYWEGKVKRDNPNLGTVSTRTYALMGAYGVNDRLNLVV